MLEFDLSDEIYREYDFGDRVYRISDPLRLFMREGGHTHRVLDAKGIVHCIPFGNGKIVLRWAPKNLDVPVKF